MKDRKQIHCMVIGILFALVIVGLWYGREQEVFAQQDLAKEVLRFHVLANSDEEEDQTLKMKVKEAVLQYMREELPTSDSLEMTKAWVVSHIEEIEAIAEELIQNEGFTYPVCAKIMTCKFPEKTYGDITFPAGTYEALRIEIGEAQGQNWWCVLYPNLCFFDTVHAVVPEEGKKQLEEVLEEDTYDRITATTPFRVRWFFF